MIYGAESDGKNWVENCNWFVAKMINIQLETKSNSSTFACISISQLFDTLIFRMHRSFCRFVLQVHRVKCAPSLRQSHAISYRSNRWTLCYCYEVFVELRLFFSLLFVVNYGQQSYVVYLFLCITILLVCVIQRK